MRVISGKSRGTKLYAPEGDATRPTADSIKESLFNIISSRITESAFLDLFSGSGAIGIEALSRGADKAVFAEKSPYAAEIIKKNLMKTRLTDRAIIYNIDVSDCIMELANNNQKFDIIFMDPPYKNSDIDFTIQDILQSGILEEDGLLIVEHRQKLSVIAASPYETFRKKDYGRETSISFIKKVRSTQ